MLFLCSCVWPASVRKEKERERDGSLELLFLSCSHPHQKKGTTFWKIDAISISAYATLTRHGEEWKSRCDRGIIRPSNIPFHMLSSPSSDPAGLHPQSFFHPPPKNHKNEKKDFDNEHIGGYNSPVHLFFFAAGRVVIIMMEKRWKSYEWDASFFACPV